MSGGTKVDRVGTPVLPLAVLHRRLHHKPDDPRVDLRIYEVPASIVALVMDASRPYAVCVELNGGIFHADLDELEVVEPLAHPVTQATYRAVAALDHRRRGAR